MQGNPLLTHDGRLTLTYLVLTDEQLLAVWQQIRAQGCQVEYAPSAKQTVEQQIERLTLLGTLRGDRVWPSVACPSCTWFDPLAEGSPCGRAAWPVESVREHEKTPMGQSATLACPIPEVWDGERPYRAHTGE